MTANRNQSYVGPSVFRNNNVSALVGASVRHFVTTDALLTSDVPGELDSQLRAEGAKFRQSREREE